MRKARNAVIIIVLCLIGGYEAYKPVHKAPLGLVPPPADSFHDAVSGNRVKPINASNPNLNFSNNNEDSMHDSVAGNAIPNPANDHFAGGPPRGATDGGFGSFTVQNPYSQTAPNPLSPSGPSSPSSPPK